MRKIILIGVLILGLNTLSAQNESGKWSFGASISAIDFSGPHSKQFFNLKQYRGSQRYFVGRYLNPSFNLKADFTFGKVWFPVVTAYPNVLENGFENRHIYDFGLNLEYKLNNGYILKETSIVSPYIFTGLGLNSVIDYGAKGGDGSDINTFIPFGAGLTIRATNWLAFNLQAAYKLNLDNSYDYVQNSAGIVLNLGGKPKGSEASEVASAVIDSDGDGVSDLIDECPFVAGTENMFGCPDTDGDGLGDSRDDCPKIKGTLLNKGCPTKDTDGDGIADDKDSCPNVKGDLRYAGCPDTDGDGIVDKYDNCPNEAGVASNSGCPAVISSSSASVNTNTNTTTTNTTTSTTTSTTNTVPTHTNTGNFVEKVVVYFGSASDVVPSSERAKLNKILRTLKSNPNYRVLIKGYTDEKGNYFANSNLSLKRAKTVWMYLSKNGMTGGRADLFGYGEFEQISSTDQINRRVVVEIVR